MCIRDRFQSACQKQSAEKSEKNITAQRSQRLKDDHGAKAVNRADRSGEKTTVDQLFGRDGTVNAFAAPAKECIDDKCKKQNAEFFHHFNSSL